MKKFLYYFLITFLLIILGCATNPMTGKRSPAFVSNSSIFPTALQQYNDFLSQNKVIKGTAQSKQVELVGSKIKQAAEKWYAANNQSDYLKDYHWEFNLVEDPSMNAWCMPGGKIVFYTGILPVTLDEAGMAAVMGHEIVHALFNHGQQRMSAGMLQKGGQVILGAATMNETQEKQQLWMTAFAGGSQVFGMLPFSRSHESEADRYGLILMAIAGYHPEQAVAFWERMSAKSGGQAPAEFMSTHPSHGTRIANLKKWIPEAKAEAAKFGITFN
jgi:predicted Zn-dependent protease